MAEEKKEEIKARELIEFSGFKSLESAGRFLQQLGDGIEYVERIVEDASLGARLVMRATGAALATITGPTIDAEIDYHRRKIEDLEEAKKARKL